MKNLNFLLIAGACLAGYTTQHAAHKETASPITNNSFVSATSADTNGTNEVLSPVTPATSKKRVSQFFLRNRSKEEILESRNPLITTIFCDTVVARERRNLTTEQYGLALARELKLIQ